LQLPKLSILPRPEGEEVSADYLESLAKAISDSLNQVYLAINGQLSLGDAESPDNIFVCPRTFTTPATPGDPVEVDHNLPEIPHGRLIVSQDKPAHIYEDKSTWTKSKVYFKSDVATVTATVLIF
jgi:hypothetical protein